MQPLAGQMQALDEPGAGRSWKAARKMGRPRNSRGEALSCRGTHINHRPKNLPFLASSSHHHDCSASRLL